MKAKRLLKKKAREAMEEKQARIVIALLLLGALATAAYWLLA